MARSAVRRLLEPNAIAAWAGERLPAVALKPLLGQSLRGLGLSLCLHRMADADRPTDWQPGLNMPPAQLDELIELLLASRPGPPSGWLTVSFDDGYADAARYIASRAPQFGSVEFIFFVCPEKLERRAGFRWDAAEQLLRAGAPKSVATDFLKVPASVDSENARGDLQAVAQMPEFELASVDTVRELGRLRNVRIGNHTNLHLNAAANPLEVMREEYARSTERFAALFGAQHDFAFPFGTPVHQFDHRHVEMLRALGSFTLWSTEARPYWPSERKPGAVLPRLPINGRQSAQALAGWLIGRAVNFRLRGSPHIF